MALIARNLLGIAVLRLIVFLFSTNRRDIRLRTVSGALLAQICIGAFILFVPLGKTVAATAAGHHLRDRADSVVDYLGVMRSMVIGTIDSRMSA
ncbi:Na+ dependent nucleoside transporter N-terminal domain-containing protein [Paraburkholderia rhynchosiae]|uniref:Concentrative nucleoside transporter N-terminal domain-containing protein n=1 Tax=Paraburkholderia rhynchosiae TaxID=487049 RepID=A0A2N7WMP7_9BURK|nr:Na+ dependent nucleoside transporter N-terminal domain-containing protein [Paraburkholderia rhynchosiae]PMS30716.1 hypothetical protein C0Z16_14310 [Paraburkholderia rhynchosiae]CAB3687105.1 hypothetical protein LMG27174_02970 [Paraburkholderia rhynchosiae]